MKVARAEQPSRISRTIVHTLGLALSFFAAQIASLHAENINIPGPQGALGADYLAVEKPHDIVIIIPGSGPTNRDGNAPALGLRTDAYKMLAQALAADGIASIRIDKRGMYASATAIPDPNRVTIAEYASDVRGWIAKANTYADCVWLIGHSEDGLVALAAAETHPQGLCGLVLLATPGRKAGAVLREQLAANPANAPIMAYAQSILVDLEASKPRAAATIPPALLPLFGPHLQHYLIDLLRRDPAKMASRWQGPVLIVQGYRDVQVKSQDAERLASAMPQSERANLKGMTHTLKVDQPENPLATYTDPALPLAPELAPTISNFIRTHERR